MTSDTYTLQADLFPTLYECFSQRGQRSDGYVVPRLWMTHIPLMEAALRALTPLALTAFCAGDKGFIESSNTLSLARDMIIDWNT